MQFRLKDSDNIRASTMKTGQWGVITYTTVESYEKGDLVVMTDGGWVNLTKSFVGVFDKCDAFNTMINIIPPGTTLEVTI